MPYNIDSYYKAAAPNSTDLISIIDIEGNYSFVGESVERQLGYTSGELVGTNAFQYIHPDDIQKASFALAQIAGQAKITTPLFRFRAKDGAYHWIETTVTNMLDDPEINGLVTNSKDVTDLVELDAQRKLNHTYYYSLFLNHPDALFYLSSEGIIYNCNLAFSAITGYNEYQLPDTKFISLIDPEYQKRVSDEFAGALNGVVASLEVKARHKSGNELYLQFTFIPVFFDFKVKEVQCVAKDITGKYLQQLELRKLSLVASKITNGVIIADEDEKIEWVNEGFCRLTGYLTTDLVQVSLGEFLIGEKNANVSNNLIRQYFKNNTPAPLEILTYKKNGEEIWFLVEITPIKNEQNKVSGFISILTDITGKKAKEMEALMLTKNLFDRNKELQEIENMLNQDLKIPLQQIQKLISKVTTSDSASNYERTLDKVISLIDSLHTTSKRDSQPK